MMTKKYILYFSAVFILFGTFRVVSDNGINLWEDHDIALNLINDGEFYYESDGVKNHTFQFPVYSSILALIYSVVGVSLTAVALFNLFIHVLTAIIFFHLFNLILGYLGPDMPEKRKRQLLFVSITLFLFHPVLIIYAFSHVHPLSLNVFTLFAGLYFSLRMALNPSRKNLFLAGLVIGLCMLDRATVLLTLVPAFLVLIRRLSFKEFFFKSVFTLTIILWVISPWLIRNYTVEGIIGFESSAAKNKWKGVLYDSDGSNYLDNGKNYYAALTEKEKLSLGKMSAIGQRDFFNAKYNEILRNDPGHVIKMFFVKLKNFWWFRSSAGTEWGSWQNYLWLYQLFYGICLLFILILVYTHFKKMLVLLSFPIALSLLQAYFYVEMRHRIAIEPLLLFLAVTSVFYMLEIFNSKKNLRAWSDL